MTRTDAPKTLRMATYNALRDRPDRRVRGNVRALLDDHPVHVLFLQETRDYLDVLNRIPGYDLHAVTRPRGADQNALLVREDLPTRNLRAADLGGDGWTTSTGHHHVGCKTTGVTVGWCRCWSIHLPPSINWPHGKPVGPPERVDDYRNAMRTLATRARRATEADGRLTEVRQVDRYGSDHPAVTFKVTRVGDTPGLVYAGDWNCRPGRDEGDYTVSWLADQAGMTVGRAPNARGHLHGIDLPLVKRAA